MIYDRNLLIGMISFLIGITAMSCSFNPSDSLKTNFLNPPDSVRPGVYWYFMDGNLSREGITADLESMKKAGIGYVIFLEVNVGVPRGKVDFLSEKWQDLFAHAVKECERLKIKLVMGSGPGWAGSGGPWVKTKESMMNLVSSYINVKGPKTFESSLPVPKPIRPYFGEGCLTKKLKQQRDNWYEDVAVMAYPTPEKKSDIEDLEEKALYYRAPYSSTPGIKPFLPMKESYSEMAGSSVKKSDVIDLTGKLQADGTLKWKVPSGKWTIIRFGKRNNGAVTRPAPAPGMGFECNKFDSVAFDHHFNDYLGKLLKKTGPHNKKAEGGWTMIHIDSWEMGSQNWTNDFRNQFTKRRGYDPLLYLPVYAGQTIENMEVSERFLWDVRLTSQELVLENYIGRFKELGRRYGFRLSIEPYDMNPTADLDLGSMADVPMCEFWSNHFGFNTAFSCIEATSIAHVQGKSIVASESFTAGGDEAWKKYPGNMKDQSDWAFCMGINHFFYHTFAHKPLGDKIRPGMTMGPYGVHWDRGQTWWPMVSAYHKYVSRCSFMLSRGTSVADILYLTPEGAPQIFCPPSSAMEEDSKTMPDKRGYSFDGCSPHLLMNAKVLNHRIIFPGGGSYRILILPDIKTMTPELLEKINSLVEEGASVVGNPPVKSPSLVNYPECDKNIQELTTKLWLKGEILPEIIPGKEEGTTTNSNELYQPYDSTAVILKKLGVSPDFTSSGPVRYIHRSLPGKEIYFIANRTDKPIKETCLFRDGTKNAELWNPVTGKIRSLGDIDQTNKGVTIKIKFDVHQSYFIVFDKSGKAQNNSIEGKENFPEKKLCFKLNGPWTVSFDTIWGGPENVSFDSLTDWTKRPEDGIRYYSGIARYSKTFDIPEPYRSSKSFYLDLGTVKDMARVKLNGKDLGIVWTAPWQVNITKALKKKGNVLEVEVANLWINRLIGDEKFPDDGIKNGKWPEWLLNGSSRPTGRYTFTTHHYYKKDDPLMPSGLLGPVEIVK